LFPWFQLSSDLGYLGYLRVVFSSSVKKKKEKKAALPAGSFFRSPAVALQPSLRVQRVPPHLSPRFSALSAVSVFT
jgi:hypothetical protein